MPTSNTERVDQIIQKGVGAEVSVPQKLASEAAQILSGRDGAGHQLDATALSSIFQNMENQLCKVSLTSAALKPGDFDGVDSIVPAKIVTNGSDTEIVFGGDDTHSAPIEIRVHTEKNGRGTKVNAEPIHFSPAADIEISSNKRPTSHLNVQNLPQDVEKDYPSDAKNKLRSLLSAELTPCVDETTGKATENGFGYALATTMNNIQNTFGFDAAKMTHFVQDTICPSKFPNGDPSQSTDFIASNKIGIANYKLKNVDGAIVITNGDGSQSFRWQPKS